jgi:hypothetical protein
MQNIFGRHEGESSHGEEGDIKIYIKEFDATVYDEWDSVTDYCEYNKKPSSFVKSRGTFFDWLGEGLCSIKLVECR